MTLPIWNKLLPNERASPQRLYERVRKEIALIVVPPTPESKIASVAVVVAVGEGIGESAAAPTLVGASVIGIVPTGNQDQLVDKVEVETDGKVKVTLAANATAQNTFSVTVLKA